VRVEIASWRGGPLQGLKPQSTTSADAALKGRSSTILHAVYGAEVRFQIAEIKTVMLAME